MTAQAQAPPVSNHYLAQAGLAAALARPLAALWDELNPARLIDTLPSFRLHVYALIHQHSLASAALAAREFMNFRRSSGVSSSFTVPVASPPTLEEAVKTLDWATYALWYNQDPETIAASISKFEGASTRMVLNTGRRTTEAAIIADPHVHRFYRETKPGSCAFCSMLASRGDVYVSAATASVTQVGKRTGQPYHDHCHCMPHPLYDGIKFNLPEQTKQWMKEWPKVTKGLKGDAVFKAWRQHIEGR